MFICQQSAFEIEITQPFSFFLFFFFNLVQLTPATECAPEVIKARNKASERQKSAKQLKMVFLKKLNRTMINSLRLYADNMLCMDLCCWPVHDAARLIGQQVRGWAMLVGVVFVLFCFLFLFCLFVCLFFVTM